MFLLCRTRDGDVLVTCLDVVLQMYKIVKQIYEPQKNGENSTQQFTNKPTKQHYELLLNSDVLNLRKCSNAY